MFQVENQTNCNSKRCDQQGAQHLPPKHRRRNRNSCHNATMPTSIAITSGRPKALSNKIRIKRFESCGEAPTCVNILTPCFDTEPKGRGRGRGRGRGIAKRPASRKPAKGQKQTKLASPVDATVTVESAGEETNAEECKKDLASDFEAGQTFRANI